MSLYALENAPILFLAGLDRSKVRITGGLYCKIPGAPEFGRVYQADPRIPEEACAFFDDFTHDLHLERNIFELVAQDVCGIQGMF